LSALADKVHVVRKGETLIGLSRRYEVGLKELAEANDLTTRTKIKIGQRIVVPVPEDHPELESDLKRQFDRVGVKSGRWKYIVIHHSATSKGTVKGMDRYHSEERHMENGLAYHFVVGNGQGMKDGQTEAGRRWTEQLPGGHLASESLNQVSLGICLVGNFETGVPTGRQLQSLAALINYLKTRCKLGRSAIKTHQQINTVFTRCPGRRFPVEALMKLVG
jgi:LysM repeat protein